MNPRNFFVELKRRNVYRVAAAYAVFSWLLIQIATQISPYFEVPTWTVRLLILLLILGLPVALILSWAFELTPEGFKRTEDVPADRSIARHTGRKLLAIATVLAAVSLALLLFQTAGPTEAENALRYSAAPIPEKSIAVLPFANLSAHEENAFFTDGVQEEILTDLSKVADLKVISRTSTAVYKSGMPRKRGEIGQQLRVAHLLEGSVQRAQQRVRVTAQLIDARSDEHIWAERYDREVADTFAIQSDIAQAIVKQLQAKLSPAEKAAIEQPPPNIEAFDLYLQAKQLINNFHDTPDRKETLLRAVRLLDEAISRDPNFALAYCWATTAHDNLYWFGLDPSPARLAQAKAMAQRALVLAPDLGEAHLAQALVYYHGSRDYVAALEEVALAKKTLPNNAQVFSLGGWISRRQGRWEDARANLEKAAELDPRNPKVLSDLSVLYDLLHDYDAKEALYDRAVVANPSTRDYFQLLRAETQLARGNLEKTRALLETLPAGYDPDGATTWTRMFLALYEQNPEAAREALSGTQRQELVGGTGYPFPRSFYEGLIARAAGEPARAEAAFAMARAAIDSKLGGRRDDALAVATLGIVEAGLGRKDEAIALARRGLELRPLNADAVDAPTVMTALAMIYAWTGEIDLAMDQLTALSELPGGPDHGQLKFDPAWAALRGDPRFSDIVEAAKRPHAK